MNSVKQEIKRVGYCTVSWGTLIRSDLIEKFANTLKELDEPAYTQLMASGFGYNINSEDDDGENAEFYLDELTTALQERAPEGFYFGVNEGDTSCFGFWPVDEDED